MSPDAITTEIDIAGANCPWVFNETLDRLRAEPGVVDARASMRGQCLRIEHRGLPTQALVDLVRRHLHGAALSSSEPVMVEIDAHEAALHCTHGHPRSEEHTSELQSLMRSSYAVFCLKKQKHIINK